MLLSLERNALGDLLVVLGEGVSCKTCGYFENPKEDLLFESSSSLKSLDLELAGEILCAVVANQLSRTGNWFFKFLNLCAL